MARRVQDLIGKLSHDNLNSWENALLMLLETYHINITTLDNTIPIDDYLDQAVGYQDAYSFPSCNPPRSIIFCTTSIIEFSKCSWLQEIAGVHGIEPNIQCIRTESVEKCMKNTMHGTADVVIVNQDDRFRAQKIFNLKPILFEYTTKLEENYFVVAALHKRNKIHSIYGNFYYKTYYS